MYKSFFATIRRFARVHWIARIKGVNTFTAIQMIFYQQGTSDHPEHNENPDYWDLLLGIIKQQDFGGKNALDFACGQGRNIRNLLGLCDWNRVDGVDISPANVQHCIDSFQYAKSHFWITGGADAGSAPSNFYDLVISTIALQHIPVYDVRKSILLDIQRTMKRGTCRFRWVSGKILAILLVALGVHISITHITLKVLMLTMMCELLTLMI